MQSLLYGYNLRKKIVSERSNVKATLIPVGCEWEPDLVPK